MSLEIKLSPSWFIVNNEHSSSGVILEHRTKSKNSSKVRTENTYHQSVSHALDFYARVVIAKNEKKVKTIREYLDEFDSISKEVANIVKEAQKHYETSNEDTNK